MKTLIAGMLMLFLGHVSHAQIERYTLYNGKRYLIHVVEKGNTMYSISRKYDVDVKSILDANPYAKDGIKFGQELRIPLFESKKEDLNQDRDENGFILHTVRRKETLFSLSQAYNVNISDIEQFNPFVRKGISVGDELRIPKTSELERIQKIKADTKNYFLHKVSPGQTLYSLSKLYNAPIDDIKALNGGLPDGLRVDEEIKIPRETNIDAPQSGEKKKEPFLGLNPNESIEGNPSHSNTINIALFLPFDAERLDTTEVFGENQIALEYYLGFKMAIDSLRTFGAAINLMVFDTEKNPTKTRSLLYRPEMSNVNLIVGPMYKSCLEVVLPFALSRNLKVLCPVPQSDEMALQFPNLILTQSSKVEQMQKLFQLVELKNPDSRMVSIAPKNEKRTEYVNMFHGHTDSLQIGSLLTDTVWHYEVMEQVEMKELEYYLAEDQPNVVFIASEEVGFVSEALTALNGLKDYQIKVIGFESWEKFTRIETEYKNKTQLSLPTNFYIDYNASICKKFFEKYRKTYHKEPNKYAVMGFDQAFFFGKGIYTYGMAFLENYQKVFFTPVASKFLFERHGYNGGFTNRSSFILTYEDFELKPFSW